MNYVKAILGAFAAIVLVNLLPGIMGALKNIREQRATGVGFVAGGFAEGLASPRFWILAILFSALFFAASHIGSKAWRVFLFWVPTLVLSASGLAVLGLFTLIRFMQR